MKVKELMSTDIAVTHGGDTVQRAANLMAEYNKGLLPVLNNTVDRKVVGVITNKDVVNKVVAKKLAPNKVFVHEVMTDKPIWVGPEAPLSEAMILLRKENIKRVLVIERDILQGVLSSNDIVNAMIKHKKNLLDMAIDF